MLTFCGKSLSNGFSVGNKVRVHQLKAELASCRQNGQPVLEYFGRLSKLWEEYQIYKPIKLCTCGLYVCGLVHEAAKEREEEKIHQFVLGLNDSRFGGVSQNIISMDPMPSLDEVYSRIIREEQRLSATRSHEQQHEAVGFMVRREQSENQIGIKSDSLSVKSRVTCSHCGRTGHEKKECWSIVGFPDWWMERSGGGRGSGGRGRGGRGSGFVNSGRGRGQIVGAHATSSNPSAFANFTQDQLKVLAQLIEENSGNGSSDKLSGKIKFGNVVLVTGASHHMTGTLSLLSNVLTIPPCLVGFADGSKTSAISMGVFPLSKEVVLTNVLYVPTLNCTLLSVSKIVKQTKCFATFTDTFCFLQDRFSKTLIGTGE